MSDYMQEAVEAAVDLLDDRTGRMTNRDLIREAIKAAEHPIRRDERAKVEAEVRERLGLSAISSKLAEMEDLHRGATDREQFVECGLSPFLDRFYEARQLALGAVPAPDDPTTEEVMEALRYKILDALPIIIPGHKGDEAAELQEACFLERGASATPPLPASVPPSHKGGRS
jgi:hypothetical protein